MVKMVVVGSIALDSIKTPFGEVKNALGGSAMYASFAASFFTEVGLVGVVGKDFPQEHVELLKSREIDLKGLEKNEDGETFQWEGYYEYDMNQAHTVDTRLNVFQTFSPKLPEEYKDADILFLGNISPDLQLSVLNQMNKRPKLVVSDTMNFYIEQDKDKVKEVIKQVDIALMNDGEARMLFDTSNLVKASQEILKLDSELAIIKKGEHGAIFLTKEKFFSIPGYPLEQAKDPTGAGDCFAGAMLGYLAKTNDFSPENIRKAIVYGSSVASFNAEGFSVEKLKTVSLDEIAERYEEFKELVKF